MSCPTCGQDLPEGIRITVEHTGKGYSVVAREGDHAGWALRKTEAEAREKALLRLRADREGWFR